MPAKIWLKLLKVALGYGSRTDRIKAMLNHEDVSVAMLAQSLKYQGYLHESEGTITI
jgi:hypothetical protein